MKKKTFILSSLILLAGTSCLVPAEADQNTKSAFPINLLPVESITIHKEKKEGLINKMYIYESTLPGAGATHLYLVAEMTFLGQDGDRPHIVGIYPGYKGTLKLMDVNGDDKPELIFTYFSGTDSLQMRIYSFSEKPNATDKNSRITSSAMLPELGFFTSSFGRIQAQNDGVVLVFDYKDESKKELLPPKAYILKEGKFQLAQP